MKKDSFQKLYKKNRESLKGRRGSEREEKKSESQFEAEKKSVKEESLFKVKFSNKTTEPKK